MMPKINEVLHIQVSSMDEEESRQEYKSRIADISEEYIWIEVPMNEQNGRLKKLFVGDDISVFFLTEGGIKNYFNSYVLGSKEDIVRLVAIKAPKPEDITKIQRRSFLRVPAELELSVKVTEQIQILAKTLDVGGGGVSFLCDERVPIKTSAILTCWLLIQYRNGSVDHVPFKGEVVRTEKRDNGKQIVMLKFTEIVDMERQKIIRFCFERQIDFRKS